MKQVVLVLIVVAAIVGSFYYGRYTLPPPEERVVTKFDTIYPPAPAPQIEYIDEYKELYFDLRSKNKKLRDSIANAEPYIVYDTITHQVIVHVPMSEYIFSDSLYKATMIGYNINDFKIELYQKTEIREIIHTVVDKKRWGIGIQAGYGQFGDKASPYIGIGVQYNLFSF